MAELALQVMITFLTLHLAGFRSSPTSRSHGDGEGEQRCPRALSSISICSKDISTGNSNCPHSLCCGLGGLDGTSQCGSGAHEGWPLCSGTEQGGIQRTREKTGSCGTWKGARASPGGAGKKQVTGQEALAWLWSHLAAPTTPLRDTFPINFCNSSTAQRLNVPQSCS